MKKKFIFVILFMFLFTCICNAAVSFNGEQLIKDAYSDVLEKVKSDTAAQAISFDNSFYRYYYDSISVDSSKPFAEHLTEKQGFWVYVINDESCVLYQFDADLNLWLKASEEKVEQFVDKDGKTLDIEYSFNGFMEFAESKFEGNIDELKITSRGSGNEYATYIYFTSDKRAYVIPLCQRATIKCGLVSGEVYDAEVAKEMFDKMKTDITSDGKQLLEDKYTGILAQVKKDTGAEDINFDNAFYSYYYDLNIDLEKAFGDHLTEENEINMWLVPNGNQTREFVYDAELKKWSENKNRYFFTDFVDKDGNLLDIKCSINGFMEFAENKLDGNIDDIKITRRGDGDNYAVYVYLESGEKSYVIPLSSTATIKCGLVSGEVYDAEMAKQMYDKTIVFHDEPVGGGGNAFNKGASFDAMTDKPDYTVYIIIGGAAAVAIIAATVTLLLKKKR